MTRQAISTGTNANDGTGDTLRSAATKTNDNFVELYQLLGGDSDTLASNVSFSDSAIIFSKGLAPNTLTVKSEGVVSNHVITLPGKTGEVVLDTNTVTLTNKTLTSPAITTPSITTSINDTNGNESIKLTATGSAVNEITVANAATGNDPVVIASGEASTNLHLKGASTTGQVLIERTAFEHVSQGSGATLDLTTTYTTFVTATPTSVAVPDGTVEGQLKIITSSKSGSSVNVTPTSSNIAGVTTQITLQENESVQLIWDGSKWYIVSGYGYSVS